MIELGCTGKVLVNSGAGANFNYLTDDFAGFSAGDRLNEG
jgi:hypothetical protein